MWELANKPAVLFGVGTLLFGLLSLFKSDTDQCRIGYDRYSSEYVELSSELEKRWSAFMKDITSARDLSELDEENAIQKRTARFFYSSFRERSLKDLLLLIDRTSRHFMNQYGRAYHSEIGSMIQYSMPISNYHYSDSGISNIFSMADGEEKLLTLESMRQEANYNLNRLSIMRERQADIIHERCSAVDVFRRLVTSSGFVGAIEYLDIQDMVFSTSTPRFAPVNDEGGSHLRQ